MRQIDNFYKKIEIKKLTDFFVFNLLDFKKTDNQSVMKKSEKTELKKLKMNLLDRKK